jgi:putative N6-adenine-specific DNA methylase
MVRKAKKNIATAKMNDAIKCATKDFFETEKPTERGVMVINPPYGERMDHEETDVFYKEIGDYLKSDYSGWDCFMISSELSALKSVGLRSSQRTILFNGSLECRLVKYEMYRGSLKEKS